MIHDLTWTRTRAPNGAPSGDSVKHEGVVRHGIVPNSQDRNQADMHELTPRKIKISGGVGVTLLPAGPGRESPLHGTRGGISIFPPPNRMPEPKAELVGGVLFAEPRRPQPSLTRRDSDPPSASPSTARKLRAPNQWSSPSRWTGARGRPASSRRFDL